MTKAGFVSLIGRPNAGKSTLMNSLLGEKIAMVSQKANATRRRSNAIVMVENTQIIFVDTPGLHEKEKVLNQYMMDEALKAMGDCVPFLIIIEYIWRDHHLQQPLQVFREQVFL